MRFLPIVLEVRHSIFPFCSPATLLIEQLVLIIQHNSLEMRCVYGWVELAIFLEFCDTGAAALVALMSIIF
jgi:hypothetical protein